MALSHVPTRRRQRSARAVLASALLVVATLVVVASLATRSAVLLGVSAVTAILLGWAALRVVWTEVLQSRRENAGDRVAAATAYRELFVTRTAENAEFAAAMTQRLANAQLTRHQLQEALVAARRQVAELQIRTDSAEAALEDAFGRIAELQRAIDSRQSDEAQALNDWQSASGDAISELVEWAEQQETQRPRHAAESA